MRSSILVVLKARVTSPSQPLRVSSHSSRIAKDLVRIDHIAVLIDSPDAVRVPIRNQARIALVRDDPLLGRGDVRQDRFRIDARKRRVHFRPHLDEGHTRPFVKIPATTPRPAPYITSIRNL